MNYIKIQRQLRQKHLFTEGEKIDRIFRKVNAKARMQRQSTESRPITRCLADYQYLCE